MALHLVSSQSIWGENLMTVGDPNIDRKDDPLYQAFTSTGLQPPTGSTSCRAPSSTTPTRTPHPTTATSTIRSPGSPAEKAALSLPLVNAGTFDFTDKLIPADNLDQLSWRISDHYPLWCEFRVPA